jgi:formylglycine-generating enzyme required for sulfatase activity
MKNHHVRILLIAAFALLPLAGLCAQSKFALVIGNGAYSGVTKLKNPVNDANDMKAALVNLGFQVDLITNATLLQMNDGVARFRQNLASSSDAYGFFFYAGYGVQSQGDNYLIPVNARIASESNLRDNAMTVQQVLDNIEGAGNVLNVVVLDACRDNPFSWAQSSSQGLTVMPASPPGSIVVFPTGVGKTTADGEGRNSLFTAQLIKNLETPSVEVKGLFDRVRQDVLIASKYEQFPEISSKVFKTAYLSAPPWAAQTSVPVAQPGSNPTGQPAAPPQQPVPDGFVRIQSGTFQMGSTTGDSDEKPLHTVRVSGFYMGKYEVTQREYEAVMGNNPSNVKGANLPVEQVSWFDAVAYCNARSQREGFSPAYTIAGENVTWNRNANGYRLPTEAEWEYACRAGTTTAYSTGASILSSQARYSSNSANAVGSFAANPWGLYDMHGNVLEWCWDLYMGYGRADQKDPVGASSGQYRVFRGGSWSCHALNLRSAYRRSRTPAARSNYLGFRLVRPIL